MTSYLTQPFTDMTQPMYDAMSQWQSDVNANTAAAASAVALARTSMQSKYKVEVVDPWKAAQLELIEKAHSNSGEEILWKQAALLAIKQAIDLVLADQMDKRMRDIAADQRDLANRQISMGEELHRRYVDKFAPIEDKVATFAITDWEGNRYQPQYTMQQGRARLDAARAYGAANRRLTRKFTRYCTGSNAEMLRLADIAWAQNEVDAVNKAWRFEESQAWRRDDVQWARLQNAIANGQRLPSQAAADMAAGIRGASESNSILSRAYGGWYGALANSAGNVFQWGYSQLETSRLQSMGIGSPMRVGYSGSNSNGYDGGQSLLESNAHDSSLDYWNSDSAYGPSGTQYSDTYSTGANEIGSIESLGG